MPPAPRLRSLIPAVPAVSTASVPSYPRVVGVKTAGWLLILFAMLVLVTVYYSVLKTAQARLAENAQYHTTRLVGVLEAAMARHSYLAVLLSQESSVRDYLLGEPTAITTGQLNDYLARANAIAGTMAIYLMRKDGLTVAASNWYKEGNGFIGEDLSFRPYFQQAMEGRLGRYYALGTTSNERGYYFSSAVRDEQGNSLGAIAVKIGVDGIEQQWKRESVDFMVTDPDGVIFMASQPDWWFRTLTHLPAERLRELRASLRYSMQTLEKLDGFYSEPYDGANQQVWLGGEHYLLTQRDMPTQGWTVHVLSHWDSVRRSVNMALGLTLLLMLLTGLLLFMLWQSQSQRRRYEAAAMEALESKVEARTRELRLAQEELVQAAKMAALGQLSAAINHELNNPLGAIRAFADNARQFLELGRTDMVRSNLQEISGLTERMAAITRQLKIFSRKSAGKLESCQLNIALDSALLIMYAKLSQTGVTLHQQRDPTAQEVRADLVWLEQILVNLLSNAMEAVSGQVDGQIWLSTWSKDGRVVIEVRDNGAGISAADMPHIFEAFFTTKSIGKGLGLGLSISYRLARDMQGELQVGNADEGGAVFTLLLPCPAEAVIDG